MKNLSEGTPRYREPIICRKGFVVLFLMICVILNIIYFAVQAA